MVPLSPWLLFACTAPLVVLTLGTTRSAISFTFNLPIAMSAAGLAAWFAHRPTWRAARRCSMGIVLAVRMAFEPRRLA